MKINEQIARLRREKGVTQEEFANIFGVSNQAVSKWEAGICCPDIHLLPEIADYFEITIDELMGHEAHTKKEEHAVPKYSASNADELWERAKKLAEDRLKMVSTSLLQRHLSIGYTQARALLQRLDEAGHVDHEYLRSFRQPRDLSQESIAEAPKEN